MKMQKLYIEGSDYKLALDRELETTCHFVYAHSKLEWKAGYDIVCYNKNDGFDFKTDRVENVIAVLPNGKRVRAKLFFWHGKPYDEMSARYMKQNPVYRCHGLLVSRNDKYGLADARQKYNEKRCFI